MHLLCSFYVISSACSYSCVFLWSAPEGPLLSSACLSAFSPLQPDLQMGLDSGLGQSPDVGLGEEREGETS